MHDMEMYTHLFLSIQPTLGHQAPDFRCSVLRRAERTFWLRAPETWRLWWFHRNLPPGSAATCWRSGMCV